MTMSIHDTIDGLGERDAVRVLALVVDYGGELPDPVRSREIEERISEAASDAEAHEGRPANAGELARTALRYLADDPQRAAVIAKAVGIPADNSRFDLVSLGVGALIIIALKTEVKLTRSEEGRWSLLVHKQPMGDSALGSLIGKLLAYYREINR